MKLYKVSNGWIGYGQVKVLVIAEDEDEAFEMARAKYKAVTEGPDAIYGERYYSDLLVECLCEYTDDNWIGEIEED